MVERRNPFCCKESEETVIACSNAPSMCIKHVELAMHVRTDGRTNAEAWLRHIDHLTFRNAHAHIRIFPIHLSHTTNAKEAS